MAETAFAHHAKSRRLICLAAWGLLAACGGGGGTPGSTTSISAQTVPFPINFSIRNLVTNGYSSTVSVGGNINGVFVSGSGSSNWARGVSSTFEGKPSFDAVVTDNVTVTAASVTQFLPSTMHQHFSITYEPLGKVNADSAEYTVVTSFSGWPTAAKVGDSGALGEATVFSDSSKRTVVGKEQFSYTVEADTVNLNSAIFVLVSVRTDNISNGVLKTFARYRVTTGGGVSPVSTRSITDELGLHADLTLTVTSVGQPPVTTPTGLTM